ncbi:type II toxin-antitoxin system VapC family toxin [Chloroflexi bacterium CFX6]|nr:type II toxin-antitoxin system VapC family toxin [Chloroflexi bacterium CFX6]
MKILLDTHAFLWWDSSPERLAPSAASLLNDPENSIIVSVASAWEIQIKKQLGKITLSVPLMEMLESQQQVNGVEILPVNLNHVLSLDGLPTHHKDPFDRILIAQAKAEGFVIASADPVFSKYGVEVIWE